MWTRCELAARMSARWPERPRWIPTTAGTRSHRRARILQAAAVLFPIQGVLLTAAQVSRRTFYQHFAGKQTLLAEHLRELERNPNRTPLTTLARPGASPRERLAALFDPAARPLRGCPFSNAVSLTPQPPANRTRSPPDSRARFDSSSSILLAKPASVTLSLSASSYRSSTTARSSNRPSSTTANRSRPPDSSPSSCSTPRHRRADRPAPSSRFSNGPGP